MPLINSNDYCVVIVPETTYGVQVLGNLSTAGGVRMNDTLEWNNEPLTAELQAKDNSLSKKAVRTVITGLKTTGTLSGDLRDSYEILLRALFDDPASPYLFADRQPTTLSYNIYRCYLNAAGLCTMYDVILGSNVTPLKLDGASGDIWKYEATFQGRTHRESITNTGANLISNIPAATGNPFIFGNTTGTVYGGKTAFNSFSINLEKTLVDDTLRYQNSIRKTNDRYIGVGGSVSFQTIADDLQDAGIKSLINDANSATNYSGSIHLLTSARRWQIDYAGLMTGASMPDAERGLFLMDVTIDLANDGILAPVFISVTNV